MIEMIMIEQKQTYIKRKKKKKKNFKAATVQITTTYYSKSCIMLPLSRKTTWLLRPPFSEQTVIIIYIEWTWKKKRQPVDKDHTFIVPRVVLIYRFHCISK